MVPFQYLLGFFLWFLPANFVQRVFYVSGQIKPVFYFSGRVALYRLGRILRHKSSVAILPEYICNVVHRAFIDAGYEVKTYGVDENFEPLLCEIREVVEKFPGSVLCLAPLMGADGGQSWVTSESGKTWRLNNSVYLIFDCCQDFSRIKSHQFIGEKNFAIVSSFNNKSFAGVMGAAVVTDFHDIDYRNAITSESLSIVKLLIFRIVFSILDFLRQVRFSHDDGYEYSYCKDFPYQLTFSGATRLQVSIGAAGVLFLPFYLARKIKYVRDGLIAPLSTPYYLNSSYVLSTGSVLPKMKMKSPYALHEEPAKSILPSVKSYYFRGFGDI